MVEAWQAFHFLRPAWLLALPVLAWLSWRHLRQATGASAWQQVVDPALLQALLRQPPNARQAGRLQLLMLLAALLACLALAGPSWQRLPSPVAAPADPLVIVLDLSSAMLVQDVPPSRLERVRFKIADLLQQRDGAPTGLVVFAGDAHLVTPLTEDANTLLHMLPQLHPSIMPLPGSNSAHGLQLARDLLARTGVSQGQILLISTGLRGSAMTDMETRIASAARHGSRHFPISVLAVGTSAGGPIPLDDLGQSGRLLQDAGGQTILASLDEAPLQALAQQGFGRFAHLTDSAMDLEYLLATPLPQAPGQALSDAGFDTWADQGYWLLLPLLALAVLAFRRGALLCLCLVLALPAEADSGWRSLWQRPDTQAHALLQAGQPAQAAARFQDPRWRAVAAYRAGDYTQAAQGFAQDPSADGHYNRGNALVRLGLLQSAMEAYEEALLRDPGHQDARYNLQQLRNLQQASRPAGSEHPERRSGQDQGETSGGDQAQGNGAGRWQPFTHSHDLDLTRDAAGAGTDADSYAPGQPQLAHEPSMGDTDPNTQELELTLSHWLRRVPDEPGALLQRKFRETSNRRLQNAEISGREGGAW